MIPLSRTDKTIDPLNKKAWKKVAQPFSRYREGMDVTSLFKFFLKSVAPESEILDLGCGTGIPFGKYTADRGFKLTGIDFSEEMIAMAKQNVPQGNFKVKSMEELKGYEEFDAIFASYSLQLLYPTAFLRVTELCSKILKSNGLFRRRTYLCF